MEQVILLQLYVFNLNVQYTMLINQLNYISNFDENELLNEHWISFTMVDERHENTAQQLNSLPKKKLITKRKIPNTALAELRGLVQDSTEITEHAIKVKEIATMVVDFIQQKFSSKRHPKLQIRSTQANFYETNDDLIPQ
ncbi:unnamed protein product [Clavelina lepadiformis]|uniref:Uncharacterized protein n=1 Tax=Clavelina lepadiformis TaxID=159417 RepID=A0ABP0F083_CLALP